MMRNCGGDTGVPWSTEGLEMKFTYAYVDAKSLHTFVSFVDEGLPVNDDRLMCSCCKLLFF